MSIQNELHILLSYLHLFQSCKGVLVVGSGTGSLVPLLSEINPDEVLLVEADERLIERMMSTYTIVPSWHVREGVVYKDTQECEYYHTNQSATNGITHPESLHAAWPNLKELGTEMCESVSFATLEKEYGANQINWLILECYGAEQIIQANEERFEHYEVVVAKTLENTKVSLDALMQKLYYRSIYTVVENNPQVVFVVYVKEYAQLLKQTTQKLQTELSQLVEAQTQKSEKLQTLQIKLSETEAKNKEVVEAKELLAQQLQTLQAQNEESKKALDTKTKELLENLSKEKAAKENTQKEIEEQKALLQKAQQEQETAKIQLQTERDSARKERDECKTAHNDLKVNFEQKVKQLTERQQQTNELQKKIQDTQTANENYKQRQTMLDEELKKAEMQIKIIKDLLMSGNK